MGKPRTCSLDYSKGATQRDDAIIEAVGDDALGPALASAIMNDTPRTIFAPADYALHWIGGFAGAVGKTNTLNDAFVAGAVAGQRLRGGDRA